MGFGGEDCAISLTDLPQPRDDLAGPGSAEGAAFLNLGEIDGFQDLQQKSEDLVPEGGVLASGGGDGPGESLPGLSSSALRNMLLYAESVNSFGARERRNLAQLDAQTGDVGCGFYDIFYEGVAPPRASTTPSRARRRTLSTTSTRGPSSTTRR